MVEIVVTSQAELAVVGLPDGNADFGNTHG
jgi:hypothetical protein